MMLNSLKQKKISLQNRTCLFLVLVTACLIGCTDTPDVNKKTNRSLAADKPAAVTQQENNKMNSYINNDSKISKNSTNQDFELKAMLPKVSKLGEPITMEAVLTNNSEPVAIFGQVGNMVECRAKVYDVNEKEVLGTNKGNYLFGLDGMPTVRSNNAFININRGESKEWTCDLNECFQFIPGEYELSLEVKLRLPDDKSTTVTVEKVPFTITK